MIKLSGKETRNFIKYHLLYMRYICNSYVISEALKLEPITLEFLKKEKGFKMGKKHQKELDTMKKKHAKERQTMQKNHCSAIEKLTKGKECVKIFYFNVILLREEI